MSCAKLIEIKYLQLYSCMRLLSCMRRYLMFNILDVKIHGRYFFVEQNNMIYRAVCKRWDEIIGD